MPAPTRVVTPQATQIPISSASTDQSASSGEGLDSFTMSWLNKFNADLQAMLRGTAPAESGIRTVAGGIPPGGGSSTSAAPVSSFTKRFQNFSDSLSEHLKNGGTGTVFHNPVMHYDLNSMKNSFTAVNEAAGVYERDGVFYATRDLNGSTVLQPVGIHAGDANGFSDDLSAEQKAFFDKLLEAKKEMKDAESLSLDEANAKLMELVKDPEKLADFMKKYGPKESEGESNKQEKNGGADKAHTGADPAP